MRSIVVALALVALSLPSVAAPGERAEFEREGAHFEVSCLAGGAMKIEVKDAQADADLASYLTESNGLAETGCEVSPGRAASSLLEARSNEDSALAFYNSQGELLLRLTSRGFQAGPGEGYSLEFTKEPGDRYFGLGEMFAGNSFLFGSLSFVTDLYTPALKLDQNGQKRLVTTRHLPPSELTMPFILNPRGYGLLIANPVRAEIDLQPHNTFAYAAEGGPAVFYVLPGPPPQVLDLYSQLTGRTPLPPKWTMGFMQSRYGYKEEAEFRNLMQQFRSRDLPCDALIFDLDWYSKGSTCDTMTMGNLDWERTRFPDPVKLMNDLDERGFKAIVILDPAVRPSSFNFEQVRDQGLVVTDADGAPYLYNQWGCPGVALLDYLNPLARDWWGQKVKAIHDTGVDGWWTDKNEPEDDRDDMYYSGRPSFKAHNLQAMLAHQAMADMYDKELPDERLFIMTRGGFVGDWRYGAGIWSGDVSCSWGHLRRQIPVGLSAGLSGYGLWNSDVGGFHGTPSRELYVRWMQFGAFCPIYRAHGNHSPREPWAYGDKAEEILRGIMELRYRLAPYFYAALQDLHQTGLPPMRAMFLEFPHDLRAYDVDDQYMYGPSILVAPVTRPGARSRSVYLPEGVWTDFWTDQPLQGPAKVRIDAPLERIPLLIRQGAVIPMIPAAPSMADGPFPPIELHLYPGADGASSTYRLYDDDGRTNRYRTGDFASTEIKLTRGLGLTVEALNRKGDIIISALVIHNVERPRRITMEPGGELNQADWTYDESRRLLTIRAPQNFTRAEVEF